jgi:hypothetical protein
VSIIARVWDEERHQRRHGGGPSLPAPVCGADRPTAGSGNRRADPGSALPGTPTADALYCSLRAQPKLFTWRKATARGRGRLCPLAINPNRRDKIGWPCAQGVTPWSVPRRVAREGRVLGKRRTLIHGVRHGWAILSLDHAVFSPISTRMHCLCCD